MHDLILKLLEAVVGIVTLVVGGYVTKWLNTQTGHTLLQKYGWIIQIAVKAVEQAMPGADGPSKKKAVENYISKEIGNKLSADDVDKLIEAAVFEIKAKPTADNKAVVPAAK